MAIKKPEHVDHKMGCDSRRMVVDKRFCDCGAVEHNNLVDEFNAWFRSEGFKRYISKTMQEVSNKKHDEQIEEVKRTGLLKAALITVSIGEFAQAISDRLGDK